MPSPSFRLEPLPGYAPTIGRLVGILLYARQTTLAAVEGLSIAELDHLHDDSSNSIGALLAHIAAVERGYQCLTFEERRPSALEQASWEPALTLGAEGRRLLRGNLSSTTFTSSAKYAVSRSRALPLVMMPGWSGRSALPPR